MSVVTKPIVLDETGQDIVTQLQAIVAGLAPNAGQISYSNATSGLSATTVQQAIDEVDSTVDNVSSSLAQYARYDDFENSPKCQSIRNKHTYDMEIESVYLIGSFAVITDGEYENLPNDAVRYKGDFVIDKPAEKLMLTNIEKQGFPFFCGSITLNKKIYTEVAGRKLTLDMRGINAVKVNVNGSDVTTVIWNRTELDLSRYLVEGENDITLTLYNNLRNLLGPHHLEEGEGLTVRPASFFKEKCMWLSWWMTSTPPWNDDYCFVETSVLAE